jgi:hypothetical protein
LMVSFKLIAGIGIHVSPFVNFSTCCGNRIN